MNKGTRNPSFEENGTPQNYNALKTTFLAFYNYRLMIDDLIAKQINFKVQGNVFINLIIKYILFYLKTIAILLCY